jgi:hypothetical protein
MALQHMLYLLGIFDSRQSLSYLHAEEVMSLFGPGFPSVDSLTLRPAPLFMILTFCASISCCFSVCKAFA